MSSFLKNIGIELPIIQAPMAGGATTVELVSMVANSGALGSLAGGMLSPDAITTQIAQIKEKTNKPFMVNLFILSQKECDEFDQPPPKWIIELYHSLNLDFKIPSKPAELFDNQFAALVAAKPAIASFAFGILKREQIKELKSQKIYIVGTINHPDEAKAWEELGADAICVQGVEAGGHRGGFLQASINNPIPLIPLLTECKAAVNLPLWAAGGLMNGQDLKTVKALGAEAAQFGTAFLATTQSGIPQTYKDKLLNANADTITRHTKLFSGKSARGIVNKFMLDYQQYENVAPPYPQQNAYTQPIRKFAAQNNDAELMSLWAGQGVALCENIDAAQLISKIMHEYELAKS